MKNRPDITKSTIPIRSTLVLLAVWVLGWQGVFGQSYGLRFDHISLEEGLSQTHVFSIVQDHLGFMWFGTEEGLNRYDGYSFKVYKHDPNDPSTISANSISALCVDHRGNLWIGTRRGGLNRFDREHDRFVRYGVKEGLSSGISLLYEDGEGLLWIGAKDQGLFAWEIGDGSEPPRKKHHFQQDPLQSDSLSSNHITAMTLDDQNTYWIGTARDGVNKLLNIDADGVAHFEHYKEDPLDDVEIRAIISGQDEYLWIATNGAGLVRLDPETRELKSFLVEESYGEILSLHQDDEGFLWLGTKTTGLARVLAKNGLPESVEFYSKDTFNPNSLTSNQIWSLFEDRSGILWIGTWGGGVHKWDRKRARFEHYRNDGASANGLSHNMVKSILEDSSGRLWIGTLGGGLNRWDRSKDGPDGPARFQQYHHDDDDPSSLSWDFVYSLYEDRSSNIWIGTRMALDLWKPETNSFTHIDLDPKISQKDSHVWCINEDNSGNLWLGTRAAGMSRMIWDSTDPSEISFQHYRHDPNRPESLSHDRVTFIYEDQSNNLWVGTAGGGLNLWPNGLSRDLKPGSVFFKHFFSDYMDSATLASNIVFSMIQDQDGVLWFGTNGGLSKLESPHDHRFETLRRNENHSQVFYSILEDGKGQLWMSTNYGLTRLDKTTQTFRDYDVFDGLQSNEFNMGAWFHNNEGEMFFGGVNGFNIFRPEDMVDDPQPPLLAITEFMLSNRPVGLRENDPNSPLERTIETTREFSLGHNDNVISFEFAALHFAGPSKNLYAYQLEGFDKGWTETPSSRRIATYTNLDAGSYTFKVKGSNKDGVWNEEGASVRFEVKAAPWFQWWAYTLYFLAATALAWMIVRLRSQRVRLAYQRQVNEELDRKVAERTRELQELHQLKTRFFTNISHEFRTPLTLTIGPLEDLLSGRFGKLTRKIQSQHRSMLTNVHRLMDLINQLLDISKLDAGQVRPEFREEDMGRFLREQTSLFSQLSERKKIHLGVTVEKEGICAQVDASQLSKVISNLLSNAFKFTAAGGKILVHLQKDGPGWISISVKDTGQGIPKEKIPFVFDRFFQVGDARTEEVGTGIGLALARELARMHGGDISVTSQKGFGSDFVVRLPIKQADVAAPESYPSPIAEDKPAPVVNPVLPAKSDAGLNQEREPTPRNLESGPRPVVLLVEDHDEVRSYIMGHLEEIYDVIEASSGKMALELAAEKVPDLVLSDVMMPGMDGFALCKALKSDPTTAEVPVVLLTARATSKAKMEGLSQGADDYITKPFQPRELLARIGNLIGSRRDLRNRYSKKVVLQPTNITISSADEAFLQKASDLVEENIGNVNFGVYELADEMGLSRRQLYRKFTALTEKGPSDFIKGYRLKRAMQLLDQHAGTVSEIAYNVGFSNPGHFSTSFRNAFGSTPTQYIQSQAHKEKQAKPESN